MIWIVVDRKQCTSKRVRKHQNIIEAVKLSFRTPVLVRCYELTKLCRLRYQAQPKLLTGIFKSLLKYFSWRRECNSVASIEQVAVGVIMFPLPTTALTGPEYSDLLTHAKSHLNL